jgi:hypothetical protein
MIRGMGDEPNPENQQDEAESKGVRPHVSKLSARQKAYQRAQQAYEATKRLGRRLNQTTGIDTSACDMKYLIYAGCFHAMTIHVILTC